MKKLLIFSFGLFLITSVLNAQDSTLVLNLSVDSVSLQKGLTFIKMAKNDIQKYIELKKAENIALDAQVDSLLNLNADYDNLIDSLNDIADINDDIIDALDDVIDGIDDVSDDLNDAIDDINDAFPKYSIVLNFPHDIEIYAKDTTIIGYGSDNYDDDDNCSGDKNKFKGHWAGVSIGANAFSIAPNTLLFPESANLMSLDYLRSREFTMNPVQFSIPFFNRYVGAVTGVGFTFNKYELAKNTVLSVDSAGNIIGTTSNVPLNKNCFKTASINIPLIIEFQIPVNKNDERIFLSAGVIGSYNLSGMMKTVYKNANTNTKFKDKNTDWPITDFSYSATARIGFNDWYAYANYSLVSLFEDNKAQQLYPVSAGIGMRF